MWLVRVVTKTYELAWDALCPAALRCAVDARSALPSTLPVQLHRPTPGLAGTLPRSGSAAAAGDSGSTQHRRCTGRSVV